MSGHPWRIRSIALTAVALLAAASQPATARAADLPGGFTIDPNSLVSDDVVKAVTGVVGFWLQHRPYEPATPLGTQVGVDISVEASLVGIPESFYETMAANGYSQQRLPSVPIAKLHLHKGFGDYFDIGGSAFYLMGNKVLGGDAKFVVLQGEEGPTAALRFCYTYADLGISGINVSTKTFSPQILVSRQLDFADPYLGAGLAYALGSLDADVSAQVADVAAALPSGVTAPTIGPAHKTASAVAGMMFGGLSLKVPRSGLRLTVEGAYSTAGAHSLGLKTGFTF